MKRKTWPVRLSIRQYVTGTAHLLFIGGLAAAMFSAIKLLNETGHLLSGAVPLGIGLVLSLAWMSPRWQAGAWSALTLWLLPLVYAATGKPIEYAAFVIVVGGTLLGFFRSPWFLVGVWFFHPVWDMLPRVLPAPNSDFPLACLIYDLIVALYLAWAVRCGRIIGPATSAISTPRQASEPMRSVDGVAETSSGKGLWHSGVKARKGE